MEKTVDQIVNTENSSLIDNNVLQFKSSSANFGSKIWTVASGKGGVGKSFVASSMGITLSKLGHSVLLIDLDLSGANLHTLIGKKPSNESIRHFFEGTKKLKDLVQNTECKNLFFIQGITDTWMPTDFTDSQVDTLINAISEIKYDYVIIDLGAGALDQHMRILKASDEKFIVTTPEPTSIEKTYRFAENYVCYGLRKFATADASEKIVASLQAYRSQHSKVPFSFREYLKNAHGFEINHLDVLKEKPIRLIVNSARCFSDEDLGLSMKSVCNKYLDLSMDYAGYITYDNAVWQSVRAHSVFLVEQTFSPLAGQFLETCKHLIDPSELRAVV